VPARGFVVADGRVRFADTVPARGFVVADGRVRFADTVPARGCKWLPVALY